MELKITTLIENNSDDKGQLLYEHGLSLYIETDGKNISKRVNIPIYTVIGGTHSYY